VPRRIDDRQAHRYVDVRECDEGCRAHDERRGRTERRVAVREEAVGDGPLFAVARYVRHARPGVSELSGDERCRTARIERHGVRRAESEHERAELRPRNADRARTLPAVDAHEQ
jgi:hypothetical protein